MFKVTETLVETPPLEILKFKICGPITAPVDAVMGKFRVPFAVRLEGVEPLTLIPDSEFAGLPVTVPVKGGVVAKVTWIVAVPAAPPRNRLTLGVVTEATKACTTLTEVGIEAVNVPVWPVTVPVAVVSAALPEASYLKLTGTAVGPVTGTVTLPGLETSMVTPVGSVPFGAAKPWVFTVTLPENVAAGVTVAVQMPLPP
jgi:hypothetical protein